MYNQLCLGKIYLLVNWSTKKVHKPQNSLITPSNKGACILSCLVPLQLVAILPNGEHEILWENDLMNSNLSGTILFTIDNLGLGFMTPFMPK